MSDDRLPNIDKLNSSNWPIWKMQLNNYLVARKLWSLCSGDIAVPVQADGETGPIFAARQEAYDVKNARVMSILGQTISTQFLYLIAAHDITTPRQAWTALLGHFERPSLSNKMALKCQLFGFKMVSGQSMDDHIKGLNDLVERLAALNAPVDEQDQVALLLRSLPPTFGTLVTAYIAKGEIRMGELREALINHECRLAEESGASGQSSAGESVLASTPSYRIQKKGPPGSCYGCGLMGHKHINCPTNPFQPSYSRGRGQGRGRGGFRGRGRGRGSQAHRVEYDKSDSHDAGAFTAVCGATMNTEKTSWVIDSGATRHITVNSDQLYDYRVLSVPESVSIADGTCCTALGVGKLCMYVRVGDTKFTRCTLSDVLYVPNLSSNFFSVRAATLHGNVVKFGRSKCWITNAKKQLVAMGHLQDQMYVLSCQTSPPDRVCVATTGSQLFDLWHQRLGHACSQRLKTAVKNKLVQGVDFPGQQLDDAKLSFCDGCAEGKMHRKPFQSVGEIRTKRILELIHSDVCGPMSIESLGGAKYFVTFVDDFSRICQVHFLKNKSEVLDKFKQFEAAVSLECDYSIKRLRTDNGGEYTSRDFGNYLKLKGIKHEFTTPYTPQQNGVAERMNRTLQDIALALMSHSGLPKVFWAESVANACYIRNRMPTSSTKMTPYERWYGQKPKLSHMRVFGCVAFALQPEGNRKKFDMKSEKLRFIGYPLNARGYKLWDAVKHQMVIRRDVTFNENQFDVSVRSPVVDPDVQSNPVANVPPLVPEHDEASEDEDGSFHDAGSDVDEHDRSGSPPPLIPAVQVPVGEPVRQSSRVKKKPNRLGDWVDKAEHQMVPKHKLYVCHVPEPNTMSEALSSEEASEWRVAADKEYNSLMEMGTWKLVKLPKNRQPVSCKWIFRVKHKSDGTIERFKARLVARGFSQQYGVD